MGGMSLLRRIVRPALRLLARIWAVVGGFLARTLKIWATATAIVTIVLFSVGGLVRGSGSGLGCSTWPKCGPGRLFPYPNIHSLIEFSHRSLAFLATVFIIATLAAALAAGRRERRILIPAIIGLPLVLAQAILGGIVVKTGLSPGWVTIHFAFAMALVANEVYLAAQLRLPDGAPQSSGYSGHAMGTLSVIGGLLLVGTYVRASNSGLAFLDWPLMNGRLVPTLGGAATWMFVHRVLAALAFLMVLWAMIRARTMRPTTRAAKTWSTVLLALFVGQIFVGALNVWTKLAPIAITLHVAMSVLIWSTAIILLLCARRLGAQGSSGGAPAATESAVASVSEMPDAPAPTTIAETAKAYFQLTKPRIIVLLLITTVPAMILAAGRVPNLWLILATLVGGTMAAGAANAINCYLDRDIDQLMKRTKSRPLPAHRVTPEAALRFGFILGAISFYFMAITVNVLAATLALSAIAFYVFVYTLWLKRSTEQNIVIGGAAGAVPALVGWAAVTGTVGLPAVMLFAIIFIWTPPHFWALAMRFQNDYAAAGVPMMPGVRGQASTLKQMLAYSLALFAVTLLLAPIAGLGLLYLAVAIGFGGMFVYKALALQRNYSVGASWKLFKFSISYLAVLFGAVALDTLIR